MKPFLCILLASCGPLPRYDLETGSLDQIKQVEAIVYTIASSELYKPEAYVEDFGYTIHITKVPPSECANHPGCTYSDGQVYVYGEDDLHIALTLAHELIHLVGYPYGRYLGCPQPDTEPCYKDAVWKNRHHGPYFATETGYTTSWEYCSWSISVNQLFPDYHNSYYEANLEGCREIYGFPS